MEERQNADTGNSGTSQQGNQPDKDAKTQSNQPERPSQPEKPSQPERSNQQERSGQTEKPSQPERPGQSERSSQSERPQRSSVPQYGRHNKRQYPHRGAQTQHGNEQGSEKEQQQSAPKEQSAAKEQSGSMKEQTAPREQQQSTPREQQGSSREQQNAPREQQGTQREQSAQKEQGSPREQQSTPREQRPQSRPQQDREQQEQQKTGEKQAPTPAVKKIVPPKGPKKVPYNSNRYRGKNYVNRETSAPAGTTQAPVAPRRISFRKISIVVPLFNEEESLRPLANEIKKIMRTMSADYEVILVDDGSTDKSLRIIKEIAKMDPKFKYVSFRKNYGKSAALQVGFKQSTGDVIVTMDADLQDDPNEIPNLIRKLEEGSDLVSGWKKERFDPFVKRHSSKFFNYVTGVMSGIKIHDFNCGLKAYRKEVVQNLKVYGELHRYMPVLADWQGYRISEIPVKHHPRRYGKTKFGISRFFKGFIDLVTVMFTTRYVQRPMHLFGFLGAIAFLIGFIVNGYLSVEWMMGKSLSNRPLLFFGMLLIIVGIQFFSVGLLGELMVHNSQNDKEYSIKDKG